LDIYQLLSDWFLDETNNLGNAMQIPFKKALQDTAAVAKNKLV